MLPYPYPSGWEIIEVARNIKTLFRPPDRIQSMDYQRKLLTAIDYMEENLREELTLQSVSSMVGLSPYHFHRIFSAVLGESVTDYLRKRRLSEAARILISSDTPIMVLALESQFDSQESFTRAFKRMFGATPGQVRKRGRNQLLPIKPRTNKEMINHLSNGVSMEPKIVQREREFVIGMGGAFPEDSFLKINAMWHLFLERKHEIKNQSAPYALGVCCPDLPGIAKGADDMFVYVAGLPVKSLQEIPEGMVGCELPASRYAVFTHRGPVATVQQTIKYIWGTWAPKGEYTRKNSPDFELYDERFDPESESGEFDIYVPIE